jgi:ribokinase
MGLSGEAWKAVDIVTPNANEATALTGIDVSDLKSAAQAAKVLLKLGPRSVVITLGQEGAYYCDANEAFHTPSFQVVARDTTGAGDAFNGGLSAAIAMGLPIREAIVKASAVAAISVTRPGAQISMPLASEVEDFLNLMSRQEK